MTGSFSSGKITPTYPLTLPSGTTLPASSTGYAKLTVSGGNGSITTAVPATGYSVNTGTAYTVTGSMALAAGGTTTATTGALAAGLYIIQGQVKFATSAYTGTGTDNLTCQFYTTNGTPGALSSTEHQSATRGIPTLTTSTGYTDTLSLVARHTATAGDVIQIYRQGPASGETATAASIAWVQILQ